jgi:hypothetical protein
LLQAFFFFVIDEITDIASVFGHAVSPLDFFFSFKRFMAGLSNQPLLLKTV